MLKTPTAISYSDTVFDDSFATRSGSFAGSDVDGNTLTYGITGGKNNGNGTVSKTDTYGVLTVTKATGSYSFVANDSAIEALTADKTTSFTITVSDGLLSVSKTLTININQIGTTESAGNNTLVGTSGINKFAGLAGNDNINGLAGNDILNGGGGNDTLRGGTGADTLIGGTGKDVYFVDHKSDKVIETSSLATEIDTVKSSIGYTLTANVENLTLTGATAINGTGNALNNILTGNTAANKLNGLAGNDILNGDAGDDKLQGGLGDDTLTGGSGKDIFQLTNLSKDKITDFSVVDDTIQLENSVFTQLTATGVLKAANFRIGTAAIDANDYVIYNSATGDLFYDADGNGAGVATQIALLGVNLELTNKDFFVI